MIVFDLSCADGHRFEGWFSSSDDFAGQQERGLVCCPDCGSTRIAKAPMAPAVPRKGNRPLAQRVGKVAQAAPPVSGPVSGPITGGKIPPEVAEAIGKLARMQADALKRSKWVGESFADQSRAMHYGEQTTEVIHGKATPKEAEALLEEGIAVAPLLFPVASPDELN